MTGNYWAFPIERASGRIKKAELPRHDLKIFNPETQPDIDYSKPFRGGPTDVGFDTFFGVSASLDMSPYCFLRGDRR